MCCIVAQKGDEGPRRYTSSILCRERDDRLTNFSGWLNRELRNPPTTNHEPPLPRSRLSRQGLLGRAAAASDCEEAAIALILPYSDMSS